MKNKNQDQFSIQNIIAKGTKLVGDFFSDGDIRVDGVIEGNIETSGKVVVGKDVGNPLLFNPIFVKDKVQPMSFLVCTSLSAIRSAALFFP